MSRLLIISAMRHYRNRRGQIAGWGPTAQEIDHLARLFEEVRHIAYLYDQPAPASAIPYCSAKVSLAPVAPSGGDRLRDKPRVLAASVSYIRTILRELPRADVVHVRAPANIAMIAMLLLAALRRPAKRWIKYAGEWRPGGKTPLSFAFQRWLLERGFPRAATTINGTWPGQPEHVHSFYNPCLTDEELEQGRIVAQNKFLTRPLRLLLPGRLDSGKGVPLALEVVRRLKESAVAARLTVAGDGPELPRAREAAQRMRIRDLVDFTGWVSRAEMPPLYAASHILLFPSETEGWPKVISEGMAFGVVPVAGSAGSIPQVLASTGCGRAIPPSDAGAFTVAVQRYAAQPERWKTESELGVREAWRFGYREYVRRVAELLDLLDIPCLPESLPEPVSTR